MGLLNEEKEDEAYYKDMNKNNHDESETDFNDLYDILFLKNNDFYKIFNVQTEQIENIMEKKDYKLLLSNLSRLIPSDFYGNRVSTKPECLFKSWKKQYQKYNQNSNDALKKYHTSLEYKYEVTLDLENFFPTINPIIIYHYIVKNLPAHLKKEDMNLMKRLLRKLLFCKLVTQLDEKMLKQYYKAFKSQTNNKETVKKSKDTKAYKEELKEIIYGKELLKGNNKILEKIQTKKRLSKKESKTVLECFVKSYSADIWTAAVGMYQIFADKHEIIKLRNYVVQIDELCFGERQTDFSYLEQTYRELIKREEGISEEYLRILYDDPYKSLKQLVQITQLLGLDRRHFL